MAQHDFSSLEEQAGPFRFERLFAYALIIGGMLGLLAGIINTSVQNKLELPQQDKLMAAPKAKVEITGPDDFIWDSAKPLLLTCDQLIGYPRAEKKVQRAREYVEKAMTLLAEAFSEAR